MPRNVLKGFSALLLVLVLILSLTIHPAIAYAQSSTVTLTFDGLSPASRQTTLTEKGFTITAQNDNALSRFLAGQERLESQPPYQSNERLEANVQGRIQRIKIARSDGGGFKFLGLDWGITAYNRPTVRLPRPEGRPHILVREAFRDKVFPPMFLPFSCPFSYSNPLGYCQGIGSQNPDNVVDRIDIVMFSNRTNIALSPYLGVSVDNIKLETVELNRPPVADPNTFRDTVIERTNYSKDIRSFFNDPDGDSLTYEKQVFPNWLRLNGGILSGTPPTSVVGQTINFTVTAKDEEGESATLSIALTAIAANRPPVANPNTFRDTVIERTNYSKDIRSFFNDPDGDLLTYEKEVFPNWLKLNGGILSGTPPTSVVGQTINFTVTAKDGRGGTATLSVTFEVKSAPTPTNSRLDFSGIQGLNNWFYGYYAGFLDANNLDASAFQQMTEFANKTWQVQAGTYKTTLTRKQAKPNSSRNQKGNLKPLPSRQEQWVARRWQSDGDGPIRICGRVAKKSARGDGILNYIFLNGGSPEFFQDIDGSDTTEVPFLLDLTVKQGDKIDFVTAPKANDRGDLTTFTVEISDPASANCSSP
ncbi:MAG: hypothetical protein J7647_18345 [Cyanobacteria bacterium SBLK]|nr:hypothetical protein [Cyanobacteria bacterium SBLK]